MQQSAGHKVSRFAGSEGPNERYSPQDRSALLGADVASCAHIDSFFLCHRRRDNPISHLNLFSCPPKWVNFSLSLSLCWDRKRIEVVRLFLAACIRQSLNARQDGVIVEVIPPQRMG